MAKLLAFVCVVSLLISLGMDTAGAQGVGSGWFLAGTPGGVPLVVTAAGDQWRYIPGFGWLNDLPNIFPGGASSSRTIIALVPTVGVNGSASAEAVTSDGEVWYNGGFPWTSAGVPPFANVSVSERDPGTMMLEASPNPADGTVLLGLGGRHGRVEVFDTTGRIVYRLAAANGAVRWDGNDEVGARVPGGVYFWRVVGAMGTGRLVVMR